MHTFKAKSAATLLPFLFERFPQVPRTRIKKWLRLQCVSINGKTVTKHDHSLHAQDEVKVEPGKKTPLARKNSVKILYQDDQILVADKPAGLLTVATEKVKTKTAYFELNEWLKEASPGKPERVFIVHRLDRETSGLLVFAKNEAAKFKLQKEWDKTEKHYYAIVEGTPRNKEDILKSHLAQNKTLKVYSTEEQEADEDGRSFTKLAVTHYRLLRSAGGYSLLDILPKTGRKNQIRVQLADIGHPIAGDAKYGSASDPARRLALHAYELSFKHPATNVKMTFNSPFPQILGNIVK